MKYVAWNRNKKRSKKTKTKVWMDIRIIKAVNYSRHKQTTAKRNTEYILA